MAGGREGNLEFQAVWPVRVSLRSWHWSKETIEPNAVFRKSFTDREAANDETLRWKHQKKNVNVVE